MKSGTGRVADVSGDLTFLNVQNQVSAIALGQLDPLSPTRDILVIAMGNSILAYDVFNNNDLFYKEVLIYINFNEILIAKYPDVNHLI